MRASSGKGLVAALIAGAVALAVPAAASATVESAQLDNTGAQFSYDSGPSGFANLNLKIFRNGVALIDQAPSPPPARGPGTPSILGVGPGHGGRDPSVFVLQLDATPDPEVVFDLFSGGAHCCFYSIVFRYEPASNSYLPIVHDWLDPGYEFIDPERDGIFEFGSHDGNFAYAFGSFANSRFPVQIFSLSGGELLDVTRRYPNLVRADLRRQKRNYKGVRGKLDVRPPLAALTADECLLGSCSKGFKLVRKANPGRFLGQLRRFLRKTGYL